MKNTLAQKWNGFAVSIPGFGHIRTEVPCQDASAVTISPREALIVCDGRGSAKLSQLGAQGAVKMFATQIAILEPLIEKALDSEEDTLVQWEKFCQIMYRTLMQVKLDLAVQHNEKEKEFDFTVAFAITGKHHIGCFQVGDGSIVLRQDGKCMTAFEPDKGEFANQTHFLREGGELTMKFHAALFDTAKNSGIAATSDGPEFKMFQLPDMIPGKIFDHLFDDLMNGELDRSDVLTYLTRNDWNTDPRGSDDRSIALLVPPEYIEEKKPEAHTQEEPPVEPEAHTQEEPPVEPEAHTQEESPVEPEAHTQEEPPVEPEAHTQEEPPVEPEAHTQEEPPVVKPDVPINRGKLLKKKSIKTCCQSLSTQRHTESWS